MDIRLTLPESLMEEAIKEGLLNEETFSEIVRDALESRHFSKKNKEQWENMTLEERRKKVDELCDKIKIDTRGHSFSRNEIYKDVNEKHGIS